MKSTDNLDDLVEFAGQLAELSGTVCRRYFRTDMQISHKADASPVTIADRSAEEVIRRKIMERFPDHGLFGEEHGRINPDKTQSWIIDPIDGTKSFITGMPTFGTLIAHLSDGVPVLGLIDIPALSERWLGVAGRRTSFNGRPCATSDCAQLETARIYTTSPDMFDEPGWRDFTRISDRAALRRFGGDCYAYGLLASGHVDAVMEMSLEPYDFMALIPVIESAGGVISDWNGHPLDEHSKGRVLATATASLHGEILALLNA